MYLKVVNNEILNIEKSLLAKNYYLWDSGIESGEIKSGKQGKESSF